MIENESICLSIYLYQKNNNNDNNNYNNSFNNIGHTRFAVLAIKIYFPFLHTLFASCSAANFPRKSFSPVLFSSYFSQQDQILHTL